MRKNEMRRTCTNEVPFGARRGGKLAESPSRAICPSATSFVGECARLMRAPGAEARRAGVGRKRTAFSNFKLPGIIDNAYRPGIPQDTLAAHPLEIPVSQLTHLPTNVENCGNGIIFGSEIVATVSCSASTSTECHRA